MASASFPRAFNPQFGGGLPDRSKSAAFGATQPRDSQRQERERERERLERERIEKEGQDNMERLTEEQKEEINEAVRLRSVLFCTTSRANVLTVRPLRPRQR